MSRVRCQVFVKLSSIALTTAGLNRYFGDDWHVEGIHNEHIVAVGVYYFDATNVSDSQLSFQVPVELPRWADFDAVGVKAVFGVGPDERAPVQFLGTVAAKSDRCIAYHNCLRQSASSFHLADPSRGGVRRSLTFLLVDPSVRIASTADVPPQQPQWLEREMISSVGGLQCLPEVLVREVMAYVGGITPAEARGHRATLKAERESSARKLARPPRVN